MAAGIGREDAKLGNEALDPALVGREARGGVILAALPFAAGEPAASPAGHAAELDMPGAEGGGDAPGDLIGTRITGTNTRQTAAPVDRVILEALPSLSPW